jgi:hypothetical protein
MHDQFTLRGVTSTPAQAAPARSAIRPSSPSVRAVTQTLLKELLRQQHLTPEEFAGWLGNAMGWMPGPGAVEAWEARTAIPPSNVILFARLCLAGVR